jgi:hypothetical protein
MLISIINSDCGLALGLPAFLMNIHGAIFNEYSYIYDSLCLFIHQTTSKISNRGKTISYILLYNNSLLYNIQNLSRT